MIARNDMPQNAEASKVDASYDALLVCGIRANEHNGFSARLERNVLDQNGASEAYHIDAVALGLLYVDDNHVAVAYALAGHAVAANVNAFEVFWAVAAD